MCHKEFIGNFKRGRIIIIEDQIDAIKDILEILKNKYQIDYDLVFDFDSMNVKLIQKLYDASSIDLRLHDHNVTSLIIKSFKKNATQTTRIIYSAYEGEIIKAKKEGADECYQKGEIAIKNYVNIIERGITIGLDRHIYSELRKADRKDLPVINRGIDIPENIEKTLMRTATEEVFVKRKERKPLFALEDLLVRRGWFANFDSDYYISLSKMEKINQLLSYLDLTAEDIGKMLNISFKEAETINSEDISDANKIKPSHKYDALLSALGFLLKLTSFEVRLMPLYFERSDSFSETSNPPPWKGYSIKQYFLKLGEKGLNTAVNWMRSL